MFLCRVIARILPLDLMISRINYAYYPAGLLSLVTLPWTRRSSLRFLAHLVKSVDCTTKQPWFIAKFTVTYYRIVLPIYWRVSFYFVSWESLYDNLQVANNFTYDVKHTTRFYHVSLFQQVDTIYIIESLFYNVQSLYS